MAGSSGALFGSRFGSVLAVALLVGTSGTAMADEQSPASKDQAVFMTYSQADLDRNYDQSAWAPNMKQVLARFDVKSALTRERLGAPETIAYGSGQNETFDLFRTDTPGAPVEIFVHGGAWRAGKASSYHFPADVFVNAGINYIALDFSNVQDVGLPAMVDQIRRAIAYVHREAKTLGVDANRIFLTGHSSGAHLAAVALTTDWKAFDAPGDVVKGATLISGLYDLRAPRLSARSSYVPFTDEIERDFSPERHVDGIATPIILVSGSLESDEFRRQAQDFAAALRQANKSVTEIPMEFFNHFELVDDYANPYGRVGAAVLQQIQDPAPRN